MNLFIVGWRASGAIDAAAAGAALERLLRELRFFPGRPVETWAAPEGRAAAAWVRHGGLPYAVSGERELALFAGRPFLWTADDDADGRAPADARFFLDPPADWTERIDGRFAAAVYRPDAEALEVVTDAVGAYPLYEVDAGGARWFSNSAALLRELKGTAGVRLESIAGLVGGGWPLAGDPIWEDIARVEPGALVRIDREGEQRRPPDRVVEPEQIGRGLDAEAAARRLTAATGALADWPDRPNVVPVTGGRDSRVVLAAALARGFDFEGVTGGAPGEPDVEVARRLCAAAGVRHSLLPPDPHGNMWSDHRKAARIVRLAAGGTASLADAAGFPLGPREGPLPLWHSGQGGEIGRAYYGSGEGLDAAGLSRRLYGAFTARRPHRPELLSDAGRDAVERELRGWVESALARGFAAADVPDLFYLERRMGTWAAPTHGCVEFVRDTTSPLWSRRVVADLLAAPAGARAAAAYHRDVSNRLAPRLGELPFAGGGGWGAETSGAGRMLTLARKAAREAVRRVRARGHPRDAGAPGVDPFQPVLDDVRDQVLSATGHSAWGVLDRSRCESLLERPAAALDEMSRYQVWRLATLFVE